MDRVVLDGLLVELADVQPSLVIRGVSQQPGVAGLAVDGEQRDDDLVLVANDDRLWSYPARGRLLVVESLALGEAQ